MKALREHIQAVQCVFNVKTDEKKILSNTCLQKWF